MRTAREAVAGLDVIERDLRKRGELVDVIDANLFRGMRNPSKKLSAKTVRKARFSNDL